MSKGLTCSGEATIFPIMRVGSGKKTPVLGIVLAMVAMGVVRWLLPSATAHGPEVAGPYVVLVSIDGLAAYELEDEALELPHIREMIRQGVWAQCSVTVFPSVTHPA
ncbi:MAG: alkaline phosphatase family protein, partial [Acidobacteriota bacterium]